MADDSPELSKALQDFLAARQDVRAKAQQAIALLHDFIKAAQQTIPDNEYVIRNLACTPDALEFELHPASRKTSFYQVQHAVCNVLPAGSMRASINFWSVANPEKSMVRDDYDHTPVIKILDTQDLTPDDIATQTIDFWCHDNKRLAYWMDTAFFHMPQTPRPTFRPD